MEVSEDTGLMKNTVVPVDLEALTDPVLDHVAHIAHQFWPECICCTR
jgi:hypothetical protein